MDIREVRLNRLLVLLNEEKGKRKQLAARIKKAPAQLSQWLGRHRTITEDSAREIEANAGKPHGWLDIDVGHQTSVLTARETYTGAHDLAGALDLLGAELARDMSAEERAELAEALATWARYSGKDTYRRTVQDLLQAKPRKRRAQG